MGFVIRRAGPGDVPGLDAVEAAAWDTTATPGPLPLPGPFDARLPLDGTVVALDGDAVIGYASVDASVDGMARPAGLLRSMAVLPAHRGRGIAAALLAAVDELARERGYQHQSLFVLGSNRRAQLVYRRAGYRVLVVFPAEFQIDGALVDDVIMGKDL